MGMTNEVIERHVRNEHEAGDLKTTLSEEKHMNGILKQVRGKFVRLVDSHGLREHQIDNIISLSQKNEKQCIFYGVTMSEAAALLGMERICPYAR